MKKFELCKVYGAMLTRLMATPEERFFSLDEEIQAVYTSNIKELVAKMHKYNVEAYEIADYLDLDPAEMVDMINIITGKC